MPNIQWKTPDDGQRNCPKHVEFLDKKKSGKLMGLLVLLKRKLVTMHGHMKICVHRIFSYTCGHGLCFCFVPLATSVYERLEVQLLRECRICLYALE